MISLVEEIIGVLTPACLRRPQEISELIATVLKKASG
jgi:hypothetical protein